MLAVWATREVVKTGWKATKTQLWFQRLIRPRLWVLPKLASSLGSPLPPCSQGNGTGKLVETRMGGATPVPAWAWVQPCFHGDARNIMPCSIFWALHSQSPKITGTSSLSGLGTQPTPGTGATSPGGGAGAGPQLLLHFSGHWCQVWQKSMQWPSPPLPFEHPTLRQRPSS